MSERETRLETCRRCGSLVEVLDGEGLRKRRQLAGMSLRELARRAGVSAAYISDVENNRRRVTPKVEVWYSGFPSGRPL